MAVAGILVAIIERAQSGKGQLVEVDMVSPIPVLSSSLSSRRTKAACTRR
jgi:crotonobetainyl-CoA:carnitine CoA-transferase CaiB-like acyl-CoA transferase